jgi:hypothetical protein
MCAKKSVIASRCGSTTKVEDSSPSPGNTVRSGYRVLSVLRRRNRLSVDRKCAGRNALSGVKVSSPEKHLSSVVATRVCRSEAIPGDLESLGTTGVQVHGEYTRQLLELGRSPRGLPLMALFNGQDLIIEFKITPLREVRWSHSSEEVE